jgi:hypothetical protein
MTIGFSRWLRAVACAARLPTCRSAHSARSRITALDLRRLSARDLADLNLPEDVASRLVAQAAEEARRSAWR